MERKTFKVLSLDGGGMRGVYASAFLHKMQSNILEKASSSRENELDIGRAFDLIVGTSSGAIIGSGLAAGIPISRIFKAFHIFGSKVFLNPVPTKKRDGCCFWPKLLRDLVCRPRNLKAGEIALRDELEKILGQETIGELWERRGIALSISAIHMANHAAWIFKTPHIDGSNHRDNHYKLSEACLASSAAPIFRSLANIQDPGQDERGTHKTFIDGGLVANNPVLVALWDALEMTNDGDSIEIFCLGTNPPQGGEVIEFDKNCWSYIEWGMASKVVEVSLNAQQLLHHDMALAFSKHFKRDCKIIRFPSTPLRSESSNFVNLDTTSNKASNALIALASADADKVNRMMNDNKCPKSQNMKSLFSKMKTFNQW